MSCERAHDDAAYVLGALSPAERDAYEQHLRTCPECRREVTALAGLPGLLRRLPAAEAEALLVAPESETSLGSLLAAGARRRTAQRRRERWRV
ncbi:MAG: anti-sigma factor family protein, partial [Micromonosporaceae bacterium]